MKFELGFASHDNSTGFFYLALQEPWKKEIQALKWHSCIDYLDMRVK